MLRLPLQSSHSLRSHRIRWSAGSRRLPAKRSIRRRARERLESVGVTAVTPARRRPEYLTTFIPTEIAKWAGPIKVSGVTIE